MKEGGREEKRKQHFLLSPPPPPPLHSSFLLSSQLSRRTRPETLATQGRAKIMEIKVAETDLPLN